MTTAQNAPDLIDVIVSDHREVERIFTELESAGLTAERRRDLVDHVVAELVRHSVAEEQYMYPAARKVLPDGDEIVDHELEEHAEAEQVMRDITRLDPGDPAYDERVRALIADIRHHIQDEERDLLPRLRSACDTTELRELGRKVLQAKKSAPTRPHPAAPDTPPLNKVLDPGAGLVDRMRDALTGRDV
ncbi:hemerythrin domain-containing protein [Nocardiopsis trehalosi]|jgi:hemerythrin superfamily protein|uniref:hemerythrin domain-containing protein n=1 Tax=Nocardiopsis trehalosi TaxID=109329 RepID=UPI00082D0199|nr:hemerythrin domain-containing protein [Nocardiopsis trehalosi]